MNHLYYGDNLRVLRESIAAESVDLIYLDPPFNSNASYNVLFKGPEGADSQAQIEAFDDTWHWTTSAEQTYSEVLTSGNTDAAEMLRVMRFWPHWELAVIEIFRDSPVNRGPDKGLPRRYSAREARDGGYVVYRPGVGSPRSTDRVRPNPESLEECWRLVEGGHRMRVYSSNGRSAVFGKEQGLTWR